MAPYGRQWFSLQDRRPAAMLAGVRRTAPLVDAFLDEELARYGLDEAAMALVGFSQGTMTSLHVGPRRARPPAAILGFSGALLGAERAGGRGAQPAAGDADPRRRRRRGPGATHCSMAVEGLQAAEIPVQWIVRPGLPHSIDPEGSTPAAAS